MLKIAKKKASRIGSVAIKVLISIEICSIVLPLVILSDQSIWREGSAPPIAFLSGDLQSNQSIDSESKPAFTTLSVCFEKGGKISATKNISVTRNNTSICESNSSVSNAIKSKIKLAKIAVQETLQLVATLYQSTKTNELQVKKSKLVLRRSTKTLFGTDTYEVIGQYELKLHELVSSLGYEQMQSHKLYVPLENLSGTFLDIIVNVSKLRSETITDDAQSMISYMSDKSDISVLGTSLNTAPELSRDAPPHQNIANFRSVGASPRSPFTASVWSTSNQLPSNKETVNKGNNISSNSNASYHANSVLAEKEDTSEKQSKASFPPASLSLQHPTSKDFASEEGHYSENNSNKGRNINMTPSLTEDAAELYRKDAEAKFKRIQELERKMLKEEDSHRFQLAQLMAEISSLRSALKKEQLSRDVLLDVNNRSDLEIAKHLSTAREEARKATEEYKQVAVELDLARNEVAYYKGRLEQALVEKAEETAAAQDAASVAVKACLRRAELFEENESILSELIDIKVAYANCAMDLDVEKRKVFSLQSSLQFYSEKLAALEVKYVTDRFNQDSFCENSEN